MFLKHSKAPAQSRRVGIKTFEPSGPQLLTSPGGEENEVKEQCNTVLTQTLLQKNKENVKLSNLVKRHNINTHKQNRRESLSRCQQMKQEHANNLRQEKYHKLLESRRLQEKLRTQLIMEESMAMERLDSLIS